MSGIPAKTLRFYHEKGLLIPAAIDGESGYRYYAHRCFDRARIITTLPTREIYVKGPGMVFKGNLEKYVTEIQIPVG